MDTAAISARLTAITALSQTIIDRIHNGASARKYSLLDIWQILRTLLECQTGLDQASIFLTANSGIKLNPQVVEEVLSGLKYMLDLIQSYVESYFKWVESSQSKTSSSSEKHPDLNGLRRCVDVYETQCSSWTDMVRFAAMWPGYQSAPTSVERTAPPASYGTTSQYQTPMSLPPGFTARPTSWASGPADTRLTSVPQASSTYSSAAQMPMRISPGYMRLSSDEQSLPADTHSSTIQPESSSRYSSVPARLALNSSVQSPSRVYSAPSSAQSMTVPPRLHGVASTPSSRLHNYLSRPQLNGPSPAYTTASANAPIAISEPGQQSSESYGGYPPPHLSQLQYNLASNHPQPYNNELPYSGLEPVDSYTGGSAGNTQRYSYGGDLPIPVVDPQDEKQNRWPSHLLAPEEGVSCMIMSSDQPLRTMNTNVLAWIQKSLDAVTDTASPRSRYHLMVCPSGPPTALSDLVLPFSEAAFGEIMDLLNIPNTFSEILSHSVSRAVSWTRNNATLSEGVMLRAPVSSAQASENWAMHVAWTKDHKNVFGFVVGYRSEDLDWLERCRDKLSSFSHGLQLPLRMIEAIIARDALELRGHRQKMFEIEMDTRFFKWSNPEDGMTDTAPDIGLDRLVKTLNAVVSQLAFHEMRIGGLKTMLYRLGDTTKGSREEFDALSSDAETLQQTVAYQQFLAGSQAQVIFSMLSQRDNRINLQISRDNVMLTKSSLQMARMAKADSSAMKTLAILSTLFLPGTFFSALFSMSMFDWKAAAPNPVISHRFWVYWAFTIPVTFIVFVFFYVFVLVDFNYDPLAAPSNGLTAEPPESRVGETLFQAFRRRRQQTIVKTEPQMSQNERSYAPTTGFNLNELPSFYSRTQVID